MKNLGVYKVVFVIFIMLVLIVFNQSKAISVSGGQYISDNTYRFEQKSYSFDDILNKIDGEVVFAEKVDGVIFYYAITPLANCFVNDGGVVSNCQIAVKNDYIVVGYPIITSGI